MDGWQLNLKQKKELEEQEFGMFDVKLEPELNSHKNQNKS